MFLVRKLSLAVMMAVAVMAMTASSANAEVQVFEEPGGLCSNVSLSGHVVSGGCHVEFQSTGDVWLVVYVPAPTIVSACQVHLEARIGGNGFGYVTTLTLTAPSRPVPCTRAQCTEAGTSTRIPQPIQLNEVAGAESLERRFCLQGPDGSQGSCTVHLPVENEGGHNYEFGAGGGEAFCEAGDYPFPVSIRNAHYINEVPAETGTEDVEIIH